MGSFFQADAGEANRHPRVLHVGTYPIGAPNNSGITLGGMFGDWPEQDLRQVCLRAHPDQFPPSNASVVSAWVSPIDALARQILGRHMPSGAVDGLNDFISRKRTRSTFSDRIRAFASATNDVMPVRVPSPLISELRRFKPDVIHSLLGSDRMVRVVTALSRKLDIPIVPHFMDDWPSTVFPDRFLGVSYRPIVQNNLHQLLERSPLILTIGEDMANVFEKRYSKDCVVVGNSEFELGAGQRGRVVDRDVITYMGGLHLGRAEKVATVASHIDAFNVKHGRRLRIRLYAPDADSRYVSRLESDFKCVEYRGFVEPASVPDVLCSSWAVLFIESDEPAISEFTRLSVSTKVPQYLRSGRPILVVGPSEQSSVRALAESQLACYAGDGGRERDFYDAVGRLSDVEESGFGGQLPVVFERGATQVRLKDGLVKAVRAWA